MNKKYFDLACYFEEESMWQRRLHPTIEKTVAQNNHVQTKSIKINDWISELELFSSSDINKPAWKDSYTIKKDSLSTEYNAIDKDLRTQKLRITTSSSGNIKQISIFNKTNNPLYSSTEELNYFPDSLYSIKKHQKVLIIGTNTYSISGEFKN